MSSFGPVSALAGLGTTLQNTIASGGRVLDILEEEPETEEITGQPDVEFGGAQCRMVTFSYGIGQDRRKGTDRPVRNFSLSIHENRIIGIVGESGCGKSTLIKLLMRFWSVNKGRIGIVGVGEEAPAASIASGNEAGGDLAVNQGEAAEGRVNVSTRPGHGQIEIEDQHFQPP